MYLFPINYFLIFQLITMTAYSTSSHLPFTSTSNVEVTQDFKANIEEAVAQTPRFLFRFWHEYSGGDCRLNTVDAITPKAFLTPNLSHQPEAFFSIPKKELGNLARLHVNADKSIQTVFSSWSQSLGFVLSWARTYDVLSSTHISILDTSKLSPANIAVHTNSLKRHLDPSIRDLHVEYLIFGVVKGSMYESRPLSLFPEPMTRDFTIDFNDWRASCFHNAVHPFYNSRSERITAQQIEDAIDLGKLYGWGFAMPFAAHLLGLRCRNLTATERRHVISRLTSMKIPPTWATDSRILHLDHIFTNKFWESEVAALLIKEAVQTKHPHNIWPPNLSSREASRLKMDSRFGEDLESHPCQGTRSKTRSSTT